MTKGLLPGTTSCGRAAGARRPASRLLPALLFAHLAAAGALAAVPLGDYRARVGEARAAVESLAPEESNAADALGRYAETAAELRRLLPPTEPVESAGATVVVNNVWLHTLLDEYEKSAAGLSAAERAASFGRIADRLGALDARLAEAERASQQPPAAPRDKDAEKGRLAAILRGKEYNREAAEAGALNRLLKRIAEALADLFPDVKPVRAGAGRGSPVILYAVLALALAAVSFVIYRYWVGRRERTRPLVPKEARVVLGERIEADQNSSDLLTEAELLAREGDLRGAIRKAYVALLCELGDRKLIRLAHHKTNRDYLRDAPPRLYEEMRPLTHSFERHWYGLEEADQTDWADFRTRCRQALGKTGG